MKHSEASKRVGSGKDEGGGFSMVGNERELKQGFGAMPLRIQSTRLDSDPRGIGDISRGSSRDSDEHPGLEAR